MKLTYQIKDKPPIHITLLLALQYLLACISATITVPLVVGNGLTPAAALFGAGAGTLVYLAFTKMRSPMFLGSSFAFIGSMSAAFAGATTVALGHLGLIIGAILAGLVYVVLAIIVKKCGTNWINKIMPPVIIGPVVAIIGLGLATSAISNFTSAGPYGVVVGIVTLFITAIVSVKGSPTARMFPFIIGIGCGYLLSIVFSLAGIPIIDLSVFHSIELFSIPNFTFVQAFGGFKNFTPQYFATIFLAFTPVAFSTFCEHLSDHLNLSNIIGTDLTKDPGLDKTLLGDGVGSAVGAFFGGAENTSYGEAIATTAFTKSASTYPILICAIMCIVTSFVGPIATVLATIPGCVIGSVCVLLYGFIASSGLKMFKDIDFDNMRNIIIISTILVLGIGGFTLSFGSITITSVACALIFGIILNLIL